MPIETALRNRQQGCDLSSFQCTLNRLLNCRKMVFARLHSMNVELEPSALCAWYNLDWAYLPPPKVLGNGRDAEFPLGEPLLLHCSSPDAWVPGVWDRKELLKGKSLLSVRCEMIPSAGPCWGGMQKSSLLFLVEAPHQRLAHTRHAHHPVTTGFQLVQDYPWCIIHIVLPAASGKKRKAGMKKDTKISLWNWVCLAN